jgi:hypothetical protein
MLDDSDDDPGFLNSPFPLGKEIFPKVANTSPCGHRTCQGVWRSGYLTSAVTDTVDTWGVRAPRTGCGQVNDQVT